MNDLLLTGVLAPGITAGMTIQEINALLHQPLDQPDITTEDVDLYIIDLKGGPTVQLSFDKEQICYDISISAKYNGETTLFVDIGSDRIQIREEIAFTDLISIFQQLGIDWKFEKKRIYLQTVCVYLGNNVNCYYSFGRKEQNDFGFFDIRCLLNGHKRIG